MRFAEHDIATELGRVRVSVGGPEGATAGAPVLFWPSLLMDGAMWRAQAEHFGRTRQVVLVDPPGHGASEPLTSTFDFDACVGVWTAILDTLDLRRVHHVGNSWGAMIGATVAARHPDRVASAALMNGTASPAGRRQRLEYELLVRAVRLVGFRGPFAGEAVKAFTGPTSRRTRPEVEQAIRAAVARLDAGSVAHAVRSVVPLRPDQRPLLREIDAPVLVVAGREDATFPVAETAQMAFGMPRSEFVVVEDGAHLLALEIPDRSNALIEGFIQRHE